jgi:hypothetical protein
VVSHCGAGGVALRRGWCRIAARVVSHCGAGGVALRRGWCRIAARVVSHCGAGGVALRRGGCRLAARGVSPCGAGGPQCDAVVVALRHGAVSLRQGGDRIATRGCRVAARGWSRYHTVDSHCDTGGCALRCKTQTSRCAAHSWRIRGNDAHGPSPFTVLSSLRCRCRRRYGCR